GFRRRLVDQHLGKTRDRPPIAGKSLSIACSTRWSSFGIYCCLTASMGTLGCGHRSGSVGLMAAAPTRPAAGSALNWMVLESQRFELTAARMTAAVFGATVFR